MRKIILVAALLLVACSQQPVSVSSKSVQPVPLAKNVNLERFMGDWYLIAHIPTSLDREAYNAVENYTLQADGSIATTYTNRQGGFDGEPKLMTPTMYVVPGTGNAQWDVVFYWWWPFRYEYLISHLEPDYSATIVARSERDFLWIFSRTPTMSAKRYQRYVKLIDQWGYDASKLMRVPQKWQKPGAKK